MSEARDAEWLRLTAIYANSRKPAALADHSGGSRSIRQSARRLIEGLKDRARRMARRPVRANRASPVKRFHNGSDGDCLIQTLTARNIEYRYLRNEEINNRKSRGPVITFRLGGATYYFDGFLRGGNSTLVPGPPVHGQIAHDFVNDKGSIKAFLGANGFSTPAGTIFHRDQTEEAETFFISLIASQAAGACLKPIRFFGGKHVHVGLRDIRSFRRAFTSIGKRFAHVLVEEAVIGQTCRILCVDGRGVAALSWRTMNVEGDGKHTVAELVERKNAERLANPAYARFPLRLAQRELAFLGKTGLGIDHVPPAGKLVFLRRPPNEDEATDITGEIHPSYVALVERALGLMPRLVWCGADLIIPDPSASAISDNYFILELNSPARFVDHHHPWRGQGRDVASLILDRLESWNERSARAL